MPQTGPPYDFTLKMGRDFPSQRPEDKKLAQLLATRGGVAAGIGTARVLLSTKELISETLSLALRRAIVLELATGGALGLLEFGNGMPEHIVNAEFGIPGEEFKIILLAWDGLVIQGVRSKATFRLDPFTLSEDLRSRLGIIAPAPREAPAVKSGKAPTFEVPPMWHRDP